MKKISVVLPVYNGEQYIEESIQSVLNQTWQDWELIIVDDCSTDRTPEIIRWYAQQEPRIQVIQNAENQKLPRSLNIGFQCALGDYFTWTSDDNRYKPEAFETMLAYLCAAPEVGLVYCDMDFIDGEGNKTGSFCSEAKELYSKNCIGACFLYRRAVAEQIGEYDPAMFLVEDYDYWLRIARQFPVAHIPGSFYEYRRHGASLSEKRASQIRRQLYRLRRRELDFLLARIDSLARDGLFTEMWLTDQSEKVYLKEAFFGAGGLPAKFAWMERDRKMDKDKQIILFGAGVFGGKALEYFGADRVAFFVDNNPDLAGKQVHGKEIVSFDTLKEIHENYRVVIAVDARKVPVLVRQLEENGITQFETYLELVNHLKKPSADSVQWLDVCEKARQWVVRNSIAGEGVINNSELPESYPEVSGYFIPTLMRWGFRDLALTYAKWLLSIQHTDGSWYDTAGSSPYVFDTAQILKGLLAVRDQLDGVDEAIRKGADWLVSNIQENGRLTTPSQKAWGEKGVCSELIHLYCLSPLLDAAKALEEPKYRAAAERVADYYIQYHLPEIQEFGFLAHFYAYVMEALCDIGRPEIIMKPMERLAQILDETGYVPAYRDVNWVCSTAMFQLAVVWFKLGDLAHGNKALEYGAKLQNESGGWYGSYPTSDAPKAADRKEYPDYFASSEISWAVKYFWDAVYYKQTLEFEAQSSTFSETIAKDDGRYQAILSEAKNAKRICDVGCGKGRYLKNLLADVPQAEYCAADISEKVMCGILPPVTKKQGILTQLPFEDGAFDLVYTVEALEHSVFAESAVKELLRVTRAGGEVVVIDKNQSALGLLEIDEWEQWFTDAFFEKIALESGCRLRIVRNLPYDGGLADGLFNAWILEKSITPKEKSKPVIFGAGQEGQAAFLIFDKKVDFFIDNDKIKQNSLYDGIPVLSLEKAKLRLQGRTVVLGTTNSVIEKEMRSQLVCSNVKRIISISELIDPACLSRVGQCSQYDYSDILTAIWQAGKRSECLYHMVEWSRYTSKVLLNPMVEIFQRYRTQGRRLVDVGCGYGFWALFFAKRNYEVMGVDNDVERLIVFRNVAEKYVGMAAAASDIRDMKCIADCTQDVVFCANTIHMVPDWRKVISEINRITCAKGLIVLVITHPDCACIKSMYQNVPFMQWDATCENVIEAMSTSAALLKRIDVCSDMGLEFSDISTHSILIFSKI